MNNAISRRTFLKCAGTAAVAAGAASLLGGCSLDNIVNEITKEAPNVITMDSITFTFYNEVIQEVLDEEGATKAFLIPVMLLNLTSAEKKVKLSEFTLKVDNQDAVLKSGKDAETLAGKASEYGLLNNDITLDNGDNKAAKGYLVFELNKHIANWSKVELTIKHGGTTTFAFDAASGKVTKK